MCLASRLKKFRKEIKLTQAQFAQNLKLTSQSISLYEKGQRELPIVIFQQIVEEFRINPLWLLTGTGEMFLTNTPTIETQQTSPPDKEATDEKLKTELHQAKEEITDLKTEIKQLNREIGKLEGRIEIKDEQIEDLKEELTESREELKQILKEKETTIEVINPKKKEFLHH